MPPKEGDGTQSDAPLARRRGVLLRLRAWAATVVQDAHAVHLAARDPRTPWYARILVLAIAAYALSPIDLIPDVIPVLGMVDDLIIIPAAIRWMLKKLPAHIRAHAQQRATRFGEQMAVGQLHQQRRIGGGQCGYARQGVLPRQKHGIVKCRNYAGGLLKEETGEPDAVHN